MSEMIVFGKVKTSKTEIRDIAKSWIIISLAFTFIFSGLKLIGGNFSLAQLFSSNFFFLFLISLGTAGLGFLLHELAHKFVAQRYGCLAEYRAFDQMLYLALGLAVVIGFLFAAPGAVMISGMITRRENGIISLAGPLTNYVLALLFFLATLLFPNLGAIMGIGFQINAWLGLFNMIPFWNLDGLKIFHWNTIIWGIMVAIGVSAFFIL